MKWQLEFREEADADLKRLSAVIRKRVLAKLDWLVENFEDLIPLPLEEEWRGFFKLRVGDWRVIYEIYYPKRIITIHYIDHRSKIYKRRSG